MPSAGKSSDHGGQQHEDGDHAAAARRTVTRRRPPTALPLRPPTQRDDSAEGAGERRQRGEVRAARHGRREHQPEHGQPAEPADRPVAAGPIRRRVSAYQLSRTAAASASTASRYHSGRYGSSSCAYAGSDDCDPGPQQLGGRPARPRAAPGPAPKPRRPAGARSPVPAGGPARPAPPPRRAPAPPAARSASPGSGPARRAPGSRWRRRRRPAPAGRCAPNSRASAERVVAVLLQAAPGRPSRECPTACGRSAPPSM